MGNQNVWIQTAGRGLPLVLRRPIEPAPPKWTCATQLADFGADTVKRRRRRRKSTLVPASTISVSQSSALAHHGRVRVKL